MEKGGSRTNLHVHIHRLVVDVVLHGLLASDEGGANLLLGGRVGGGGELGLQLGLERPLRARETLVIEADGQRAQRGIGLNWSACLRLHHQLAARVGPARKLGGSHRDLGL